MGRKRIVFLDEGGGIGGAEINLLQILPLLKEKFSPLVIVSYKGDFYQVLKELGIEVAVVKILPFFSLSIEVGNKRIANPFAIFYDFFLVLIKSIRLVRYLSKENISLLHTNSMFAHFYGGLVAKIMGIPCVWHMQDIPSSFFLWGLGRKFLNLFGLFFVDKIIVISEAVKSVFPVFLQKKIVRIYNGIDLDRFKRKEEDVCRNIKKLFGEETDFFVGMTSRIVPWKGHRIFLHAARIVLQRFPNTKFLIVGDTIFGKKRYLLELKNLAKELDIFGKVIFTGFQKKVEEILGCFDVFVHPSLRPEPFGLDIIEAMAMEVPVVATNIGAPREIINNGEDGILVSSGDPKDLAEGIIKLLTLPQLRQEFGKRGRQKVERYFSRERFIKELEQLYNEVCN